MDIDTSNKIKEHLSNVMERIIERRCKTEPFSEEEIIKANPFGFRLVPIEVWKGAKFERSFVTTLGQGIFEQLAKIIAEGTGATAENQYNTKLRICTWRLEKIDEILKALRENRRKTDWGQEVSEILSLSNERFEEVTVKSDLYICRTDGTKEYYSFKTVKPNLDQTERAKRDMLRLLSGDSENKVYFALPFNPAGEGNPYKEAGFTIPFKIFDLDQDESVLIGSELWNKIGNNEDTYEELLSIFNQVGGKYSEIIRSEYFDI
ncbi:TdeIII family type II restriction endonuclease [Brevibacillus dissolubilis]|uniref:TdeIII family type II restriction endonuclease n=1 Tax=Brevibacillus dissolubilis TaxID=1844116 RepID=UPI0011168020|nr:TdeIII family type II restriction endonuclease [Brevibacillus dissolubilis]